MTRIKSAAFTIVELLVVIVIIAILTAITTVVFNGVQQRARISQVTSGLTQSKRQLDLYKVDHDSYPLTDNHSSAGIINNDVSYQYTSDGTTYCLTGIVATIAYTITNATSPSEGVCSGHVGPSEGGNTITDGTFIQTINSVNCPEARTRAVDARDNHTYWVQKLADGKCWMLTDLAYGGGGTDTYNDTKALTDGVSGQLMSFTTAYYYTKSSAPSILGYATVEPIAPSTSTNGTGQYGYLYNWCAAMGEQTSTSACAEATTPLPNQNISVCPAGWRLPTGGTSSEFATLNIAINGGSTSSDAGLRTAWLAQWSGRFINGSGNRGTQGYYWSSTQGATAKLAYQLMLDNTGVNANGTNGTTNVYNKSYGYAVRCVAN